MQSISAIHTVTGPTVTIEVPTAYQGKQVKVVVTPIETCDSLADALDELDDESPFMKTPELSEAMKKRLAEDPTFMERSVLRYDDPFGPACPPEDWEANS